ncbi:MAG: metallophosphoesterase [Thermoguttaceae bacterium]|nr:metallophosphoesterase [Thermoguttaceae bacterium]MDW8078075.1 metallophosphoesterase [Thermoguttaceae bacterium]
MGEALQAKIPIACRSELNIAVFGDVHGHLRLMLSLCQRWQEAHGRHLDAVLICGDLGFFGPQGGLDRATRRHADKDPEELGYARFFALPQPLEPDPLVEKILLGHPEDLRTVACPMIFCHGNHENHAELRVRAGSEVLVNVDYYGRLFYLRSGCCVDIGGLRVVAIGGGPEAVGCEPAELIDKWVSPYAVDLAASHESVHVLLTHAPPALPGEFSPRRSALISLAIELVQPYYQFYGHVRNPCAPITFGGCTSYWLQNVCFRQTGSKPYRVAEQCMGILTWESAEKHSFSYVDEPWFAKVHSSNWWPRKQTC